MAISSNNVTVTTTDPGYNPASATASVVVAPSQVPPPTTVSTGLTNDFLVDSFFLPMLVALVGVWLYKQGFIGVPKWARVIQSDNKERRAQKQLYKKVTQIKEKETFNKQ